MASALSGPVGSSVSYVLGLDAVVLGDGGVSSGDVGRVPGGAYTDVSGVDTMVSLLSVDVCVTLTVCHEVT